MSGDKGVLAWTDEEWREKLRFAAEKEEDRWLDLHYKGMTLAGAQRLADALRANPEYARKIKGLSLHDNPELGDAGLAAVAEGLSVALGGWLRGGDGDGRGTGGGEKPALQRLWIRNCGLTDLSRLVSPTSPPSSSSSSLSAAGAAAAADSSWLSGLTTLHAGGNNLTEFPTTLCNSLTSLEWLILDYNEGPSLLLPSAISRLPEECKIFLDDTKNVQVGRPRTTGEEGEHGPAMDAEEVCITLPESFKKGYPGVPRRDITDFTFETGKLGHSCNVRVVLVGDAAVGKTTLAEAMCGTRGFVGTTLKKWKGTKKRAITFGVDVMTWQPPPPTPPRPRPSSGARRDDNDDNNNDTDNAKDSDGGTSFDLMFSLWDFAGQPQYHPTHIMFLDGETLYLVTFNAGAAAAGGAEGIAAALRYLETWISLIAARAPGARVIVVGTHGDDAALREGSMAASLLREEMRQFFASKRAAGVDIVSVPSTLGEAGNANGIAGGKSAAGISGVVSRATPSPPEKYAVVDALNQDSSCKMLSQLCARVGRDIVRRRPLLPERLLALQKHIRTASKKTPVLSKADFVELMEKELEGMVLSKPLLAALVDWGWICHFPDKASLSAVVFLDPQWLAKCLACVVERIDDGRKRGRTDARISRQELVSVWRAHISKRLTEVAMEGVLDVMLSFDLATTVSGVVEGAAAGGRETLYVVPSLLPAAPPENSAAAAVLEKAKAVRVVSRYYTFSRYPSGFLSKVFVRLHGVARDGLVTGWQDGLFFERVDGAVSVVLRAELVDDVAIAVVATRDDICDEFEIALVQVASDIGRMLRTRNDQAASDFGDHHNTVVVFRDRIALRMDEVSGAVARDMGEPVEFLASKDIDIGKEIAKGGFGRVVLARTTGANPRLPRDAVYAMKLADRDGRRPAETYEEEYQVMRRLLPSDHCVAAVAYERDPGTQQISALLMPQFDMALDGVVAARVANEQLPWFGVTDVTGWLLEVCKGMDYMHRAGYAHLDVKAANIMVRTKGMGGSVGLVAVGDFGTAVFVGERNSGDSRSSMDQDAIARLSSERTALQRSTIARVTSAVGSPGHIAPEILRASQQEPVEGTDILLADLYSFGIMVSVLVSGIVIGKKIGDDVYAPTVRRGAGGSVRPPKDGDSPAWDNLRGLITRCVGDDRTGRSRGGFAELLELKLIVADGDRVSVDAEKCAAREPRPESGGAARSRANGDRRVQDSSPEGRTEDDVDPATIGTASASSKTEAALLTRALKAERGNAVLQEDNSVLREGIAALQMDIGALQKNDAALHADIAALKAENAALREQMEAVEVQQGAASHSEQLERRAVSAADAAVQWMCENQLEAVAGRFAGRLRAMDRATLFRRTLPELLRVFDGDQAAAQAVFDAIRRLRYD